MGLILRLLLLGILISPSVLEARWEGPVEIVSGQWGEKAGQFGIREDDGASSFPSIAAVTPDGFIVISDSINKKQLIFSNKGLLVKEVKWTIKSKVGARVNYIIPEYAFDKVVGYSVDGNIYTYAGHSYLLVSSSGKIIKEFPNKPLEIGEVSEKSISENEFLISIKYPDMNYVFKTGSTFMSYIRDNRNNVETVTPGGVWSFTKCGRMTGELILPGSGTELVPATNMKIQQLVTDVEYGEPIVSMAGDVYAWKKASFNYSILKWTWVDDPNVITGPDAPTNLAAAASIDGIYLTWKASPQDPGCVTSYEIYRATTAGGVGSTIGSVNAGQFKFNDTTATAGTTYYYKIRAMSGSDPSAYTSEASAKR